MADKSLRSSLRPQSVDNRVLNPNVFPFDAFKFDDPNRVENPVLRMKDPWSFEAGEIEAGSITTDKLAIGVVGTIYNQPLAPNTVFLGDVWIDSDDDQYHIPYGGEIDYSVGGAGADVTEFDSTVGGAGADVETFEEEYGNIPSYAGWIQSAYAPGTTLIDGGMIETDSLKSANYVEGVSGSKFDLASGYIETGSGVYRGDLSANELISGAIHSPDYVEDSSGWSIASDGSAEFNDIAVRGIGDFNQLRITDIEAGTISLKANLDEIVADSTNDYCKLMQVCASGTVNLSYEAKLGGTGQPAKVYIYKIEMDGTETELEAVSVTSSTYSTFTHSNISVNEGDTIKIKAEFSASLNIHGYTYVQNAYLKINKQPGFLSWLGINSNVTEDQVASEGIIAR